MRHGAIAGGKFANHAAPQACLFGKWPVAHLVHISARVNAQQTCAQLRPVRLLPRNLECHPPVLLWAWASRCRGGHCLQRKALRQPPPTVSQRTWAWCPRHHKCPLAPRKYLGGRPVTLLGHGHAGRGLAALRSMSIPPSWQPSALAGKLPFTSTGTLLPIPMAVPARLAGCLGWAIAAYQIVRVAGAKNVVPLYSTRRPALPRLPEWLQKFSHTPLPAPTFGWSHA